MPHLRDAWVWLAGLHAAAAASLSSRRSLRSAMELPSFYHTTEGISSALHELKQSCPAMSIEKAEGTGASGRSLSMDVVTIRKPGTAPINKAFLLFGEHARELISAESGLHFVRALCGQHPALADQAAAVLEDTEFQIVVNGNPQSRSQVEKGDFCLRVDPDGVDLNRNWDEMWQPEEAGPVGGDTNPGDTPFSEAETRIFKRLVESYMPTTFLTVHSGTKGLYMPWAYDMGSLATRNQEPMMEILGELDENYCQCPYGAAGKEVGYSCPGTCLDWVYDKLKTPYAFAFEIFVDHGSDLALKQRWEAKTSRQAVHQDGAPGSLAHPHFQDLFEAHPSDFIQLRSSHAHGRAAGAPEYCFSTFNPASQEDFEQVTDNWSGAYLRMAALVASRLRQGTAANTTDVY